MEDKQLIFIGRNYGYKKCKAVASCFRESPMFNAIKDLKD
jgi:hypothetical protein